jgi:hypothetical protein
MNGMSYAELEKIHICMTTVVSKLNIFWSCEKIIRYCGEGAAVMTKLTKDRIEVF